MLAAHPDLPEWQPPDAALWGVLIAAVVVPLVMQVAARCRLRPTAWVGLLVALLVASRQAKMVALVLLVSAVCAAAPAGVLWQRLCALPDGDRLDRAVRSWPFALVLLGGLVYLQTAFFPVGPVGSIPIDEKKHPLQAVDWLAASTTTGQERGQVRLLVPLGWGGMAIYHLHSRFKVSMDGRNTTVYAVPQVNADAHAWRDGRLEVLLAARPDVALVPTGQAIDQAFEKRAGWRRVFRGPIGSVWVADGFPLTPPERPPARRHRFP
jgi:hypothetical protein